jgi:hypothetical protein
MELQRLIDQWESMGDMGTVERHDATEAGGDEGSGWTAAWVLRVLFAPHRIRASYQEEEALRSFEQTQREGTR